MPVHPEASHSATTVACLQADCLKFDCEEPSQPIWIARSQSCLPITLSPSCHELMATNLLDHIELVKNSEGCEENEVQLPCCPSHQLNFRTVTPGASI